MLPAAARPSLVSGVQGLFGFASGAVVPGLFPRGSPERISTSLGLRPSPINIDAVAQSPCITRRIEPSSVAALPTTRWHRHDRLADAASGVHVTGIVGGDETGHPEWNQPYLVPLDQPAQRIEVTLAGGLLRRLEGDAVGRLEPSRLLVVKPSFGGLLDWGFGPREYLPPAP